MKPIAVLDLETDPFEHGKMIQPFVAGFYDGHTYKHFWSDDCVAQLVSYLGTRDEELIVYAHNGGRFDFFYFIKHLSRECRIVNSRIIQAWLGKHEFRDSFAIMPFALETYKKTPIDYQKFTKANRESNRVEISEYLKDDCVDLHTLCVAFREEFGDSLTIGGASMKQLKKFHKFSTGSKIFDEKFRKHYYFGGRNQVFKSGVIEQAEINVYDMNSAYACAMRDYLHPVSTGILIDKRITDKTCFVEVTGRNDGAFPVRLKDNSLDFTLKFGTFRTTIHEFNAAIETGAFKPQRVTKTYGFERRETFAEFVTHFYDARRIATESGNKIRRIFYKFVLNSAYGKFAQNPENYCDWFITEMGTLPPKWHDCVDGCEPECKSRWSPAFISGNEYIIWSRPLAVSHYYNIATGASITGATRAMLLRGLRAAKDAIYCDTDSIICSKLVGVPLSDVDLGAWKLEAVGNKAVICGKKLYAIFQDGECIKKAHKGGRLTGAEIERIALGGTVEAANPVPTFKWDGSWSFTKRKFRKTAK